MNWAQLRAFHAVAREGSFTTAARALRLTQPTVSSQVSALEEGYGVRLFDRRGRRVVLTALGSSLHAATQRLFALEDEVEDIRITSYNVCYTKLLRQLKWTRATISPCQA